MRAFTYERAADVRGALAALAAGGEGARFISGGTNLLDLMKLEIERPTHLVDISRLPLRDIEQLPDGGLRIGAQAANSDTAAHAVVRARYPVLSEALVAGASGQLRNKASIGGNVLQRTRCPYFYDTPSPCNKREPGSGCSAIEGLNSGHAILGTSDHCVATHPSDLAVALVALDALLRVRGPRGERTFPVENLYRLPGDTPHLEHTLEAGELIVEVRVPHGDYSRRARYLKVRDRASYEFALVSTAAALQIENGVIRAARLAAGGVGTRPWRLRGCENALVGKPPRRDVFETAAHLALDGARLLSGNRYKLDLLPRTIVRALEMAGDVA